MLHRKAKGRYSHRNNFPFIGMLICGKCGCAITAESQKGHTYYRCSQKGVVQCRGGYIREELLAYQLGESIARVAIPLDWADKMLAEIEDMRAQSVTTVSMEVKRIQSQLDSVQAKLDRLLDAYLDNAICKAEYLEYKAKWIPERSRLNGKLKALSAYRNPPLEQLEGMVKVARDANATAVSEDLTDLREFYRSMSAELVLGPETVMLSEQQTQCRDQGVTLLQREVPVLTIKYPPEWRVLDERSDAVRWLPLLEGLKSVFGVSDDVFLPEEARG